MDYQALKNLQETGYQDAVYHIIDHLRGSKTSGNYLLYLTTIAALSLITKEKNSIKQAMDYVKDNINDETTFTCLEKIKNDYTPLIDELSKKHTADTLKAAALFYEPAKYTEAGSFSTPEGVSSLAIALLGIEKDDIILDLGSGVNSFLIQVAIKSNCQNLYGVEINTNTVVIANIRSFILGLPIKVIQGNILSQDFTSISANKVFSNYPIGLSLASVQKYLDKNHGLNKYLKDAKRTISVDWLFAIAAYLNMKKPGKAVVLMGSGGTWNKSDEVMRKQMIQEGLIEAVIHLPERLFAYSSIPTCMVILSQNNKNIRMVNASKMYTPGRRINELTSNNVSAILESYLADTENSKIVSIEDIADHEYILNPQRHIGFDAEIKDGIHLNDLCLSINRGAMIRSSQLDELASPEDTNYRYLMLQNINDGEVDSNLPSLVRIDDKYKKHCLNNNSLIISKNSPFKIALVKKEPDICILPNGNLYTIELDSSKINPVFVEVFLQSEAGIAQLNRLSKGAVMKSISIQDLKTVKIPKLSREKQDQIAKEYEQLQDELKVLQKQLKIIRNMKSKQIEREY